LHNGWDHALKVTADGAGLGAWLTNTRECLAMLLRPGNAGSNTFTDHREVVSGTGQAEHSADLPAAQGPGKVVVSIA